jgi:hypothetical protein
VRSLRQLVSCVVLLVCLALPSVVSADGISGFLELDYNIVDTRTTDTSGTTTDSKVTQFRQRLNLSLSKTLYPNLRLLASGLFDNQRATDNTGGVEIVSKDRILQPYISLTLRTPLFGVALNYARREEKSSVAGFPSITDVNESYTGLFNWRPEGFPTLDLRIVRTNTFDKARLFRDDTDDLISLLTQYEPARGVGLVYRGSYENSKVRLEDLESKTWTHNAIVNYDGKFFSDRVRVSGSYEITRRSAEITATGTGEVSFPIAPFAGLFSIDDTPTQGALDQNPALVDGNTTASAGINIGLPPPGGDTKPRNMGLDFFADTKVNEIFIYVDRDISEIASAFSWDIYTSQDNLNWTLQSPMVTAAFVAFQKRFEIRFPDVQSRYIKVVVNPLSPVVPGASGFPDIFVTEMQAFITQPAPNASQKIERTTHNLSLDGRVRILDVPELYYEVSYFLLKNVGASSSQTWALSNGLSLAHRFNAVFSGSARVAREDSSDLLGMTHSYVYTASINATPLPTLTHSLNFNGRIEDNPEGNVHSNGVVLFTSAELYKGISINASGGLQVGSTTSFGVETSQKSTLLNVGASIVPNPRLTMGLDYYYSNNTSEGGGRPSTSFPTTRADVTMTFRPFPLLYLVGSWGIVDQQDRNTTVQGYTVSWTPFPGGQLQCGLSYTENIQSATTTGTGLLSDLSGKVRIFLGSVRWNITRRSYLQVLYQITDSSAVDTSSKTKLLETTLMVFF